MNNAIIIGTGKIGIDLYIKLKRNNIFDKIFIFNTNKFSEGAKYCKKKKFLYYDTGVYGVKKYLNHCNIIFEKWGKSRAKKGRFFLLKID